MPGKADSLCPFYHRKGVLTIVNETTLTRLAKPMLFAAALIWGSSFFIMKGAVDVISAGHPVHRGRSAALSGLLEELAAVYA